MVLTFADTHNMIAFLTKSDASKGFEQIIDFLNTSVIQYALMVNPTIYVSCIKQFWSFVSLKKTNDVVRLQALIYRRKVIITEDTVRQALRLDDADSIDCLPYEEIFAELARMGLEKKRKLKASRFKRLRKVGTTQRVESSTDTVMDDQEDASKQKGGIAELDADGDVTLEEVDAEVTKDADETDEAEPADIEEVIEVVTTTKLMTEVVTTAATPITTATTITAALVPKASALRRRKVSVQSKVKSKDKGKGILVEEPKPLKKQAQIEQDKAYARELEVKLNANINWNEVIEQVKRKERQDNAIIIYQALKRKPITEVQARKNMMVYLKKHGWIQDGLLQREDLEMPWKIVQERFGSSEPKNFSDDHLLNALKTMFEKPNVEANI
nr:hypothetical protein [Tanacetum cinerariifolium]